MRLFAALVPPPAVLEELDAVVRSASPGTAPGHRWPSPGKGPRPPAGLQAGSLRSLGGRFGRLPGRRARDTAPPQADQLNRLPLERIHIPIATFGHLTRVDSELLAEALRSAASSWERPTLRLAGGTALEFPGDTAVWARLDGDLDLLQVIAQGVPKVVQRLALFVDRREFRPWLCVGTINDATTAPYLEDLVAALEGFEGTGWTQDALSLMSGQPEAGPSEPFGEVEAMPLAEA